jgi:membrane protein YdbS with pleckstrin-like domain
MADDRLVFSSKIDMWLLTVLVGGAGACIFVLAQFWSLMTGPLWWAGILLVIGALLPLWIVLSTRYAMSDAELFVRCGPFSRTVPIADITSVERTSSPLSSPALSLDRLRIDYAGGSIAISPEPRQAFLRQLEHRRQTLTAARSA